LYVLRPQTSAKEISELGSESISKDPIDRLLCVCCLATRIEDGLFTSGIVKLIVYNGSNGGRCGRKSIYQTN